MNKFLIALGEFMVLVLVAYMLGWLAVQLLRAWAAPPPLLGNLF